MSDFTSSSDDDGDEDKLNTKHLQGKRFFQQKKFDQAAAIFVSLLEDNILLPTTHQSHIIILANLCATLKKMKKSPAEIKATQKKYTPDAPAKKLSGSSSSSSSKSSPHKGASSAGPASPVDPTHGTMFTIDQVNDEHRMAATLLLSQCDEMGLGISIEDCCHAMQGYGWNEERAMDALLNGMRAPPPPPRAKAFDVTETTMSVRVPDNLYEGDEFIVVFDDERSTKYHCPPADRLENDRIIIIKFALEKEGKKKKKVPTANAVQEDVEEEGAFCVRIPDGMKSGEELEVIFSDGKSGFMKCPENSELKDDRMFGPIRRPGKKLPTAAAFDEDTVREGAFFVCVPDGLTEGQKFEVTFQDGTAAVMKCPKEDKLNKSKTRERIAGPIGKPGSSRSLPKFNLSSFAADEGEKKLTEKSSLIQELLGRPQSIWLHPKNSPPVLLKCKNPGRKLKSEEQEDQEFMCYVMFRSTLLFQQNHPELYPMQSRTCMTSLTLKEHEKIQVIAYQYAAHGDHEHRADMQDIFESVERTCLEEEEDIQAKTNDDGITTFRSIETEMWLKPETACQSQVVLWNDKFNESSPRSSGKIRILFFTLFIFIDLFVIFL